MTTEKMDEGKPEQKGYYLGDKFVPLQPEPIPEVEEARRQIEEVTQLARSAQERVDESAKQLKSQQDAFEIQQRQEREISARQLQEAQERADRIARDLKIFQDQVEARVKAEDQRRNDEIAAKQREDVRRDQQEAEIRRDLQAARAEARRRSTEPASPTEPRGGRPTSDFREIQDEIVELARVDPTARTSEQETRLRGLYLNREQLVVEAERRGVLQDVDATLGGFNEDLAYTARYVRLDRLSNERLRDVEAPFWIDPDRTSLERTFGGIREYRFQRGLTRIEDKILRRPERPYDLSVNEWDLRVAERDLKAKPRFRHITEGSGGYQLLVEGSEDVHLAAKDLLKSFEANLKKVNSKRAMPAINDYMAEGAKAIKDAAIKVGLDPKEEQKIIDLFDGRLLFLGAQIAITESNTGNYVDIMLLGPENRLKEYLTALLEDMEGLPYLAVYYLERNNGEYFRLQGREPDIRINPRNQTRKEQTAEAMKSYLVRKRLRGDLKQKLETGDFTLKDDEALGLESRVEELFDDISGGDKQAADEAFEVAERILDVLGMSSRFGAIAIETNTGLQPFEAVVIDQKLKGVVPNYAFNYANSDSLRDFLLAGQFPPGHPLKTVRDLVDPRNEGGGRRKESIIHMLENQRRLYYIAVEQTRKDYREAIRWIGGGKAGLQKLFYFQEYTRNSPGIANADGLIDMAELGVRDFPLEVNCRTVKDLMGRFNNPSARGGSLIGGFDCGWWLGRVRGANEQADRFAKKVTDGSLGFFQAPLKDTNPIVQELNSEERRGLLAKFKEENVLTWPKVVGASRAAFESFQVMSLGYFAYLNAQAPASEAAQHATIQLYNKFIAWLDSPEYSQMGYPPEAKSAFAKKALREILEKPPFLLKFPK